MEKLQLIQEELKAPKNLRNKFGNYNYRSTESILEAVKPLLKKHKCKLTLSDEIVEVGIRVYIKATAKISDGKTEETTTAFAREPESRKGMDESQVTGSSSSYARKFALNGLFLIDDSQDPDSENNTNKGGENKKPNHEEVSVNKEIERYKAYIKKAATLEQLTKSKKALTSTTELKRLYTRKVNQLMNKK